MIRVESVRNNGIVHEFPPREMSACEALGSLMEFEFGYGGQLVSISPTRLQVRTQIMGVVDTSTFLGDEQEMLLLCRAAALYMHLRNESFKSEDSMGRITEAVHRICGGSPLIITRFSPLLIGNAVSRVAIFGAFDLTEEELAFAQSSESLRKVSISDLCAAMYLRTECGVSLQQVFN